MSREQDNRDGGKQTANQQGKKEQVALRHHNRSPVKKLKHPTKKKDVTRTVTHLLSLLPIGSQVPKCIESVYSEK